ncbi:alcohol dehydrogenase, partial [Nonomuraea sp. NEAU-L178]|nr:alcohol dehydrogenase [Nonomuraea aurantiaca]
EDLWIRNLTITTGLVDTYSTPTLLDMIAAGRLDPSTFITHRFTLDDMTTAYETFADPTATGALKVVLSRG